MKKKNLDIKILWDLVKIVIYRLALTCRDSMIFIDHDNNLNVHRIQKMKDLEVRKKIANEGKSYAERIKGDAYTKAVQKLEEFRNGHHAAH